MHVTPNEGSLDPVHPLDPSCMYALTLQDRVAAAMSSGRDVLRTSAHLLRESSADASDALRYALASIARGYKTPVRNE